VKFHTFLSIALLAALMVAPVSFSQSKSTDNLSRQVTTLKSAMSNYKGQVDGELTNLNDRIDDLSGCNGTGDVYAPGHPSANASGCAPLITLSDVETYIADNCGFFVDNPGSISLHAVELAGGGTYDLYDGNSATAILKWRCDSNQTPTTLASAQGAWCGLKMSHHGTPVIACDGHDPMTSCPAGYTPVMWAIMGGLGGNWHTCFKAANQFNTATIPAGSFCGIKMSHHGGPVIACDGHDPMTSCPAGYVRDEFALMGGYGGNWNTCKKQTTNNNPELPGSLCGIKMSQHGGPVVACGAADPQISCPQGYSRQRWALMGGRGGDWYSCTKD